MRERFSRDLKHVLGSFSILDLIIIAVLSAGMIYSMVTFVPPLEKAKEVCIQEIYDYPLDQFMKEERAEINELKRTYEGPVSEARTISELDDIKAQFVAELDNYPTREDEINVYIEQIQETLDDIYSKKDRSKAEELVEQFKEDASKVDNREDLYNLYSALKQNITTSYRTKEQVENEQEKIGYLVGTWEIPGSYEYPFTLYSGGGFEMAIKSDDGKSGSLSGSWQLEGSQVYIYISENSLNPDYKPFTWVFDYNTVDKTLEGTGDYYGWIYHRSY